MRLSEGQLLDGRYRLTHRIGSGGMADVWAAEDTELGRRVALKVLHDNFARDREFVERFRREASSAAGLQHPNVVGVFDRGEVDDTYYIAMELIEGSSLRELISGGLEISESIEVTRQVLAAARFAHAAGIVHRDLKPMNVLIDRDGRVRVADFGIARAGGSEITQTGSVMGTAQYLSPEQAQGMEITAAADIYSIGVILFEMLTGRVPFDGENAVAIAMKQVSERPPPPSSINAAVPPALEEVVLRALAKDPDNRYSSAEEMLAALDAAEADPQRVSGRTERYAALAGAPPPDDDEEERRKRRRWIIAGLIAVLLLAGLAYALLIRGTDQVQIPGVEGQREAAATIRIQNAGFEVQVERVPHAQPEGIVIEQDPRGGTDADEGSTVTLTVSLGPSPEEIPEVAGMREQRARDRLERAGFEEIAVERETSEEVEAGRVIRTEPREGTEVAIDQEILLVVSSGTDTATVPSVVGMDRIAATAELQDAGFLVNADSTHADEPENQVIRQIPAGGATLERGEVVRIVYSTGAGSIVLDDLVGQRLSFAERRLANQGMRVTVRERTVSDRADDGIVLEQLPSGGTRASPGDRVSLVVGVLEEEEEPQEQQR
jgi:eukaryotic-like serine/threonine-protein kinase